MAVKTSKEILWEVGCEGHTDAWVVAPNWELATVEAAKFWGVPWATVAAHCQEKRKTVGAKHNICCKCGRMYAGKMPMCMVCRATAETEEAVMRRRLNQAYRLGKVM